MLGFFFFLLQGKPVGKGRNPPLPAPAAGARRRVSPPPSTDAGGHPHPQLTQRLDGALGGLLVLGAAARHQGGDGEGVGPGGELRLGGRRVLHGHPAEKARLGSYRG